MHGGIPHAAGAGMVEAVLFTAGRKLLLRYGFGSGGDDRMLGGRIFASAGTDVSSGTGKR